MFDKLIDLTSQAQKLGKYRVRISYSPITDWLVEIHNGDNRVIRHQNVDPYCCAAAAYMALTSHLLETYGGY